MTFVITEPCVGVKDGSCVTTCPVDCIHTDAASDQYFIDPDECIDCAMCVDVCPVNAIYPDDEVPTHWAGYTQLNAAYFRQEVDHKLAKS